MKIIGLTGGIGSGKTTVLNLFQQQGVPVYIADIEAKKIMHSSPKVMNAITELFGEEAYVDAKLNREYIAEIVFNQKEKLLALNEIVHPAVHEDFQEFVSKQQSEYVIYESALLYENKTEGSFDKVILVTAPIATRIERVQKRDGISKVQIEARINNQLPDDVKKNKADYVLYNLELEKTEQAVLELHKIFSR
ncbi:dephospho-CoA kinase [Flavicella marina]|uniref:dephospho-CoA kinase n=1 Tax=Flavicella marina TaxID=1475951 RepID=UPI00126460D6|nr:dephospho-CoA kinase [Flavicella marina]